MFARGRKLSDPHFLVLALQRADGDARVGMAISRRHARTAVERNRIKRLVREAFRRHRPELPGLDLVVMLRANPRAVPNPELRAALERLFGLLAGRRPA